MPWGEHSWLPKGSCLQSKTRKIRATFCLVQATIRYVTTYEYQGVAGNYISQ